MRPANLLLLLAFLAVANAFLAVADAARIVTPNPAHGGHLHHHPGHGHHPPGHGHHHRTPLSTPPNQQSLVAACAATTYPDACVAAARPYAAAYPRINATTLLKIMIAASNDTARAAATHAHNLAADLRTPPLVALNLQLCPSSLGDALDAVEAAKYNLDNGDASSIEVNLSAVLNGYTGCTEAFEEMPTVNPNPIANELENLRHIAVNALDLTKVKSKH